MDKSGKYYWAVFEGREVLFGGSFNDCWKHLVTHFSELTVAALAEKGIRIARAN